METDDKMYSIFLFSLFLVFNNDFFIYIDIAGIGTSNAAADDVTS